MIYTVTLNPSIDYVVSLNQMNIGLVNRLRDANKFPGGKGINVSRVLNQLNVNNTALGFLGGFTGKFVAQSLDQLNVNSNFVEISGDTRINVKIHAQDETELNAKGPKIMESELQCFIDNFNSITEKDIVIFSGSIPENLPQNLYDTIIKKIKKNGAQFVVDTTGKGLMDTLPNKPLLIKPNNHELGDLFDTKVETDDEIEYYGKKLVELGAQNVMISMAAAGGMLVSKDHVYRSFAPKGKVLNSVGAGDSMLAGFVGEYVKTGELEQAFKQGLACGSATAFSLDIADKGKIREVLSDINVFER
ncbi:1-phosphofructokinase [Pediococcus stilesii]|uniref:Tagatose-6-phosphate kinase n=1 Tax=Pediococcus stilesii TaxID=331679 RepID=A0A5R9BYQ9_9LACO|nr:1-phosphofructokinase [Pediococcus stilesii]TLQ04982.1 1-phosphofructokinase [Pediococcus stilesii]